MTTVPLKDIRIDGGTQPRVSIDEAAVADYADSYRQGQPLPPVDVFWDGAEFWLADGFHRFHATKRIGAGSIRVTVHQGTKREAVLFSAGANQGHGLRRTNEDKRKAVTTVLGDADWRQWSDKEIARRCAVSDRFVGEVRTSLRTVHSERPVPRTYTTKHGTEATMEVSKIGRPASPGLQAARTLAIDGATPGMLKKLPRKADAVQAQSAVHALQGIASVMAQINAADLAQHPDAASWHRAISDVIGVLRAFKRQLPQAEKKEVA